ncbi:MAG: hypothetical protein KF883_07350 [Thermomicrobiales bacterium]|nr:hypothetical protein [Thermomicrobiales bacterium]
MYYEPQTSSGWPRLYIYLAGVITGIVLGWVFQGIIGTLIRLGMIVLVIAAALYIYNWWSKSKRPGPPDIPEADWRDLNRRHRS